MGTTLSFLVSVLLCYILSLHSPVQSFNFLFKQSEVPRPATNCLDLHALGFFENGWYRIWPLYYHRPVVVFCDMVTDGGGWTVFQFRDDITPRQHFNLSWSAYKHGFGKRDGEFWLGNELLFILSNSHHMELRVDLETFGGEKTYAKYSNFLVRSERENFRLTFGSYRGNAGDSLTARANNSEFSTVDRDNDKITKSCAIEYKCGWWFKDCFHANLNGPYVPRGETTSSKGIIWFHFKGDNESMKKSEMKIRPEM
ncbi:techylectin-5B-like isoform X2 [Tachypleus tridentatus]|uniref:techylectin-5B-like isoform X2 n=1 Tax=Tachypleus tridentatus TaxID=6853 RepID=UPI003FD3BBF3